MTINRLEVIKGHMLTSCSKCNAGVFTCVIIGYTVHSIPESNYTIELCPSCALSWLDREDWTSRARKLFCKEYLNLIYAREPVIN